jgi:transposase
MGPRSEGRAGCACLAVGGRARWGGRIATSQGSQVIQSLPGKDFLGWLITDRWSAYDWYDPGLRQLCWAHLTRDFQSFIDRGGQGGQMGRALMAERHRMFR